MGAGSKGEYYVGVWSGGVTVCADADTYTDKRTVEERRKGHGHVRIAVPAQRQTSHGRGHL